MNDEIHIVYMLGHSRSGSTIISMHLGQDEHIFYTGEIKKFDRSFTERTCTCGEKAVDCSFWGPFIEEHRTYFEKDIRSDNGLALLFHSLRASLFGFSKRKKSAEQKFLNALAEKANISKGDYLLDSSKSLNRYILYRSLPNVTVHTIYLERETRANIASFVKRGKGLLASYFRLKMNSFLTKRYLKRNNIDYLHLRFEHFLEDSEKCIKRIKDYLDINHSRELKNGNFLHLISGNRKTRYESTSNNLKVNKNVNKEDVFTKRQLLLLKWLGA